MREGDRIQFASHRTFAQNPRNINLLISEGCYVKHFVLCVREQAQGNLIRNPREFT